MTIKDEIGIEREYWLLDKKGRVVEPELYGFPRDEYGFLVEIRTQPHTSTTSLLDEFRRIFVAHHEQARTLDLHLDSRHTMKLSRDFVEKMRKKYNWNILKNLTANIHSGIEVSHATGIDDWTNKKTIRGTAGLHVHFSRKRIIYRSLRAPIVRRIQLPIRKIVIAMDARFNNTIALAKRITGEYELKPYGFEYRSLPADITLQPVVKFAFMLLERDRKGLEI